MELAFRFPNGGELKLLVDLSLMRVHYASIFLYMNIDHGESKLTALQAILPCRARKVSYKLRIPSPPSEIGLQILCQAIHFLLPWPSKSPQKKFEKAL